MSNLVKTKQRELLPNQAHFKAADTMPRPSATIHEYVVQMRKKTQKRMAKSRGSIRLIYSRKIASDP